VKRQAGLTLIEILVVLAVLGLIAAILVIGLGRAGTLTLRTDAGRLAAALRSAFDRAAATGAHHRVIVDLDAETFQVERCEGRIRLRRSEDEAKAQDQADVAAQVAQLKAQATAAAEANALGLPPGTSPTATSPPAEAGAPAAALGDAGCGPVPGTLGKLQTLRKDKKIDIRRVFVSHLEKPAEEGKVTLNFFPLGRAEKAVVEVGQKDELFTLIVHPLTGRVEIQVGEFKHPEEFVVEDAQGEEQFSE
jgi:general secretion pathway protein H